MKPDRFKRSSLGARGRSKCQGLRTRLQRFSVLWLKDRFLIELDRFKRSSLQRAMSKESRTVGLLEVLFPRVRAELLRLLFGLPHKPRYVRELASMSGLALSTVQDELRKLSAVGILTNWTNRYRRFYRPNGNHPVVPELRRIVELSSRHPQTGRSAIHRRRSTHSQARRRPAPKLRAERALNWHLFSPGGKT